MFVFEDSRHVFIPNQNKTLHRSLSNQSNIRCATDQGTQMLLRCGRHSALYILAKTTHLVSNYMTEHSLQLEITSRLLSLSLYLLYLLMHHNYRAPACLIGIMGFVRCVSPDALFAVLSIHSASYTLLE